VACSLPAVVSPSDTLSHPLFLSLCADIGDISYARGYAAQWDRFLEQIAPLAMRVPYMTNTGRRESETEESERDTHIHVATQHSGTGS